MSIVQSIQLTPDYIEAVTNAIIAEWDRRQAELQSQQTNYDARIAELKAQAEATVAKIRVLSSESAIKFMEEDLIKIEAQINELKAEKDKAANEQPLNIRTIMTNVKYYMEHLDELLLQQINPVAKAGYFGVLFNKAPTYEEIKYGT